MQGFFNDSAKYEEDLANIVLFTVINVSMGREEFVVEITRMIRHHY